MSKFNSLPVDPYKLNESIFKLIGKDWTLITAGTPDAVNTMTASWGCAGILWNKPVCICFIRPQRHTLGFVEANDRLSLSFFDEEYRAALTYCGRNSGRDVDKFEECDLTPVFSDKRAAYIEEARLVLLCRKLYVGSLKETEFLDTEMLNHYKEKDYHKFFICEIEEILKKD